MLTMAYNFRTGIIPLNAEAKIRRQKALMGSINCTKSVFKFVMQILAQNIHMIMFYIR